MPSKDLDPDVAAELEFYKSQIATLESELADFQASSRELEAELEKELEASEKQHRTLKEKNETLRYEVDEWKVSSLFPRSVIKKDSTTDMWYHINRRNTNSLKPRPILPRISSRKRLLPCESKTGAYSFASGIWKYPTIISRLRRE